MNGRLAKKLRKEVRRSELRLAGKSLEDFKLYVNSLPVRARLVLAYKIIRRIL